ncbi:hypothetical protein BZL30_9458 [Mycobacterium kansasii]|uniref:Uncharacterized protein n=1 Tax=Mycobacterium kansasii TaxID=1768 RepID=A0A1V3W958_MYCKA|nr:hypothetical protein BZL30_9458 [Mycobacterium kansasii]
MPLRRWPPSRITVVEALRLKGLVRDSVGLGTSARERNLAGECCCEPAPVRRSRDRRRCRHHRATARESVRPCGPPSTGGPVLAIAAA